MGTVGWPRNLTTIHSPVSIAICVEVQNTNPQTSRTQFAQKLEVVCTLSSCQIKCLTFVATNLMKQQGCLEAFP